MSVDVESQVAGRVIEIEKQVGDALDSEDVILLLESMKMEIPVEAPAAGVVAEICVDVGESVSQGQILARID